MTGTSLRGSGDSGAERATDPAALDFSIIGPQLGERFPAVHLPDQSGCVVDLHGFRAKRKAIVVFHRSAEW